MLKNILHIATFIVSFLSFTGTAMGQQGMFFSNYIQDATAFNPAYAGSQGALSITAQHRHQWAGGNGAPASQGISIHSPLWSQNLGVGIRISNDQLGGFGQQSVAPSLAYRIRFSEKRFIAAGLQAGFIRQQPEFGDLLIMDPDDPAFAQSPVAFAASVGTGIFYASETFYAGFAIPELFSGLGGGMDAPAYRSPGRAYVAHMGVVFALSPEVKLKPNALLVVPEKGVLYADLNMLMLFREVLWLGGSYRLGQGVSTLAQIQLTPQLALGYSYDLPVKGRGALGVSSHEISVQYRFFFIKSNVKSPRYF